MAVFAEHAREVRGPELGAADDLAQRLAIDADGFDGGAGRFELAPAIAEEFAPGAAQTVVERR